MCKRWLSFAAGVLAMCMVTTGARALTFSIDTGNAALSGYTGPYATAIVNLIDSTHATVTFDSLMNGGNWYLLGDGGSVAVNVNATAWTLGTVTGSNDLSGFTTPGPYSSGGAGNEDGFGSFNQTIDSFDGFTHTSTEIVVPLTNNSGTWADVASVLTPNASGWQVGAHIFVCGGATAGPPGSCNDYATTTGFAVGDPVGNPVPLPGALPLFATGLGGVLGLLGWRRKRKLVAIPV